MRSRIVDKLRYAEKPELEIAEGVTVTVNNSAMSLLEASEIVTGEIKHKVIVRLMELLYSPEDIDKINALNLTMEDFMTVITESVAAAMGGNEKNAPALTLATT